MREGPEQEILAYVFILLPHAYLGVATPRNGSECFEGGREGGTCLNKLENLSII